MLTSLWTDATYIQVISGGAKGRSTVKLLIKRAQLAFTTPCARAHMHFADGSIKVLEKSCGQKTWTKNLDKKPGQKTWTKNLDKKPGQKRATNA
jgi:hypothetical protein